MPNHALLPIIASQRYSRQVVSHGTGAATASAAGAGSINVSWPGTAGAVTANTRTFLCVALKPGTANLGSVATPAGWTLIDDHIGGGYGATLADGTGNTRVYLFYQDNVNTVVGSVAVTVTPDGANGVSAGAMSRIEKMSGAWQPIVTAKAEATVDALSGSYTPSPGMILTPGDIVIYAFASGLVVGGGSTLNAGADMAGLSPSLATGTSTTNGFDVHQVMTGRRAQRGFTLGEQILTLPTGICRGPLVAARMRVR